MLFKQGIKPVSLLIAQKIRSVILIKTCKKCGATISDQIAKFCPECGTPVNVPGKKSRIPWIIAGAAGFILVLAGVLYYALWRGSPSYAAKLMPGETDMLVVVNPSLNQFNEFTRIKDIYMAIPEVKKALESDFKEKLKNEFDVDFEKDIKPWLGREIAFAFPDIYSLNNGRDPVFIAYVATKDRDNADSCIKKFLNGSVKNGFKYEEKTYQGSKMYVEKGSQYPLVISVNKDFLLVSNNENAVFQALDRDKKKDKQSLAEQENYKKIIAELPGDRAGSVYINPQRLFQDVPEMRQFGQQIKSLDGMGIALSFVKEGIRLDSVTSVTENYGSPEIEGSALQNATEVIPEEAFAVVGSANLKYAMENLLKESGRNPDLNNINEGLNEIRRETGIDVQQDILSWMRGEAIIALLPENNYPGAQDSGGGMQRVRMPVNFIAVLGVKDIQSSKMKMEKIAYALTRFLSIESDKINGQEVYYLVEPRSREVLGGYAIYNDLLVIASSREALQKTMGAGGKLVNSVAYKKSTESLPSSRSGFCNIDVGRGIDYINSIMSPYERRSFEQEVYPFIKPIKSVNIVAEEKKGKDKFIRSVSTINIE